MISSFGTKKCNQSINQSRASSLKSLFSFLKSNPNYRADIDGLRAIACLAVVLYHAFPNRLPGGFIGVDIFFVISGFLISSILFRNLFNPKTPGKVNIIDFYVRRIKRIFPALIAVLLFCIVIGNIAFLPDEYNKLAKHIFGGSTYISNIMLFKESGEYFNESSNLKPLLHLWSLGVEEQFYIVFPIFLWLLYKSKLNFLFSLIIFTLISFFLNKNAVTHGLTSKAFYMPWMRFWELSSGAILAYAVNYYSDFISSLKDKITNSKTTDLITKIIFSSRFTKENKQNLIANALSFFGIATIIIGYAVIRADSGKFPGALALVPVVGALLIIAAGPSAIFNRYVLSSRIFVFFGLISYPLYLWHWPLISIGYIIEGQKPYAWIRAIAVILSILLATGTYFFIEPPLRYGKHLKVKAVALLLVLTAIGTYGFTEHKYQYTQKINSNLQLSKEKDRTFEAAYRIQDNTCLSKYPNWKVQDTGCYIDPESLDVNSNKNIVAVFGDSKAEHFMYGLKNLPNRDYLIQTFGVSYKVPFYNFMSELCGPGCKNQFLTASKEWDRAFDDVLRNEKVKVVILSHASAASRNNILDTSDPSSKLSVEQLHRVGAKRTFDLLKQFNKQVIVVQETPYLPIDPKKCVMRKFRISAGNCSFDRKIFDNFEARKFYDGIMQDAAKNYDNITFLDLSKYLCDEKYCYLNKDGKILYSDGAHFNIYGSTYFAKYLDQAIKTVLHK